MIAEMNVMVDHFSGFFESGRFMPVNTRDFEDRKEVFSHRAVIEITNHGQVKHALFRMVWKHRFCSERMISASAAFFSNLPSRPIKA